MTTPSEHLFKTWDDSELFYRSWAGSGQPRRALVLFHRGHEHSARWQEFVDSLGIEDLAIFAWDARGHGQSPGPRGSAESLSAVVKDVDAFVRHISATHAIPMEEIIVLAHSVGAVSVAAWVHDYAPKIRAMILATPAFRVKLYVPLAVPLLRLKEKVRGPGFVKSYVKAGMLTHDREQAAQYKSDELIFPEISVKMLLDLHDTSTRLLADAGAIQVPALMIGAGADWVVSLEAQRQFYHGISSSVKQMHVFPGAYHAIFHETMREQVVARIREFIRERFDAPPVRQLLLDADEKGYTWEEYERLKLPGNIAYAAVRAGAQTIGRLSKGVRLGWKSGFDSGLTLDYVYKNRVHGKGTLGRAIDKSYLESIGWKGIRRRKVHLEKLLRRAIEETDRAGRPVRILDIATGGGRYVLETMRAMREIPMSAMLRDYKQENVEAVRALAAEWKLDNVAVEVGDAFDREALAALEPRPTIGIVSGLYELFPENGPVLNSLFGVADAIEPDGFLIYTNQPWHPQVEFIARVLRNREGKPWIMRRRTQAEMDQLVEAVGFEKIAMEIDRWGIFTVSIARRAS